MSTVTEAEAEVIARGWQAYRHCASLPWPAVGAGEVARAETRLWTALEMHGRFTADEYPVEALLREWAAEAGRATDALIAAVRDKCGDEAAEYVSGGSGTRYGRAHRSRPGQVRGRGR
jgi:hypothetical protein